MVSYEKTKAEAECPECGVTAPERQIENIGTCERCAVNFEESGSSTSEIVKKWGAIDE